MINEHIKTDFRNELLFISDEVFNKMFDRIMPDPIDSIEWKMKFHASGELSVSEYESKCGRFVLEIHQKRKEFGDYTKPKHYYYMNNDDDIVYDTQDELIEAYNLKMLYESEELKKLGYKVVLKPTIVKVEEIEA